MHYIELGEDAERSKAIHKNTWKNFERQAAALIGGTRYTANQGGQVDVEGPHVVAQCKKRASLSHAELAKEVTKMDTIGRERNKLGCVLHQVPRKAGGSTVKMITLSFEMFEDWFSFRENSHR